ncbi:MAG: hypothetical protein IPP37_18990 [Saprospiraceae bacterium]|nr:hypothetical protein [Saprospiraceae bacterium]
MNQNPEQIARDHIDKLLLECGWHIQDRAKINLNSGLGIAVREYLTDVGPADYVLFVDKKPVGVVKGNKKETGINLVTDTILQIEWLHMIKDYVAKSFYINRDGFDLSLIVSNGGLTKMRNLFGGKTDVIIRILNKALAV